MKKRTKRKKKEISDASLLKLPPLEHEGEKTGKENKNENPTSISNNNINNDINNINNNSSNKNKNKKTNTINTNDNNIINDNINNNDDKDKVKLDFIDCIFFSKYTVIEEIADTDFSKILLLETKDQEKFAAKIEHKKFGRHLLEYEYKIMDYLRGDCIPKVKLYGTSGDYNILIMQVLGKSLEYYIEKLETFSIKTTAMLAYQMINILQYIHLRNIIHRDIKPGNFVMGLNEENLNLYIIDFGFAKKYKSTTTLKINPLTEGHDLTGTSRYSSINTMKGLTQSPRDDLESLAYLLYFFLKGSLPWIGIKEKNKENLDKKILEKKISTVDEILGKDLPIQFCEFLKYSKQLHYDEMPDYNLFKEKMMEVISLGGGKFDKIYDWTDENKLKEEEEEESEEPEVDKVETTCCKM